MDTDTWSLDSTLPNYRMCAASAVDISSGLLYLFGGYAYDPPTTRRSCDLSSIECYNPELRQWNTEKTRLNIARSHAAAVYVLKLKGFLLMGGTMMTATREGNEGNIIEFYSPEAGGIAKIIAARLPEPGIMYLNSLYVVDGHILIFQPQYTSGVSPGYVADLSPLLSGSDALMTAPLKWYPLPLLPCLLSSKYARTSLIATF